MFIKRKLSLQFAFTTSWGVFVCRGMSTANRIAVAQLCSTSSKLQNLINVAHCAQLAKKEGCSILFLPENCGYMGESGDQTLIAAEPPISETVENDSEVNEILKQATSRNMPESRETCKPDAKVSILDGLQTIAKESNLWISAGGIHISTDSTCTGTGDDDVVKIKRAFNTHVILDNLGCVKAVYQKIHLFDVSIPGKFDLRESKTTAPGKELVVCDSPVGRLGLSICYDVRFPEMYISLVEKGAEILLVPSAFTVPTGTAHWHILLRARAIESQCYVIAAAQFGKHNAKRESYGHSLVVDPWGEVIVDAGGADGPGTSCTRVQTTPSIITCEIDRYKIASVRERMPVQLHRTNAEF